MPVIPADAEPKGHPMTSNESRDFAKFCAAGRERLLAPDLDLATIRDIVESAHIAAKEPEGVTYAEVDAGGVEALWCVPADSDPRTVLLHIHMGGSVVTSMHSDRKPAAHIAKAAGMRSLVVDYRRSPEHKFPAQIEDVEKAYDWLLGWGYRPENIATVGQSIGGNLAIALAIRLRDKGAALPGAIVSISPWSDLTLSCGSIDTNANVDMVLTRGLLEFFRSCWLDGTGVCWDDPRVNLLNADLRGLPPIAFFYGADELLADEVVRLSLGAKSVGNDQQLRCVEGGQHAFIMGAGWVPEVDAAIAEMGKWLRRKLLLRAAP
jgi:epsilon-lactone hydrolase